MNGTLRDFLNLKEDGTMNYSLDELMDPNSGWSEMSSINPNIIKLMQKNRI